MKISKFCQTVAKYLTILDLVLMTVRCKVDEYYTNVQKHADQMRIDIAYLIKHRTFGFAVRGRYIRCLSVHHKEMFSREGTLQTS